MTVDATPAPADASPPPIACEGGCGRRLRSRYVRDWCSECFRNLPDEKATIFTLHQEGLSQREIARRTKRSAVTIAALLREAA